MEMISESEYPTINAKSDSSTCMNSPFTSSSQSPCSTSSPFRIFHLVLRFGGHAKGKPGVAGCGSILWEYVETKHRNSVSCKSMAHASSDNFTKHNKEKEEGEVDDEKSDYDNYGEAEGIDNGDKTECSTKRMPMKLCSLSRSSLLGSPDVAFPSSDTRTKMKLARSYSSSSSLSSSTLLSTDMDNSNNNNNNNNTSLEWKLIDYDQKYVGDNDTKNVAEYMGLIRGVDTLLHPRVTHLCKNNHEGDAFFVDGDRIVIHIEGSSSLVMHQIQEIYRAQNPNLRRYKSQALKWIDQIRQSCKERNVNVTFEYRHIDWNINVHADKLAEEAIHQYTKENNRLSKIYSNCSQNFQKRRPTHTLSSSLSVRHDPKEWKKAVYHSRNVFQHSNSRKRMRPNDKRENEREQFTNGWRKSRSVHGHQSGHRHHDHHHRHHHDRYLYKRTDGGIHAVIQGDR
jgi:ribonuclease HI